MRFTVCRQTIPSASAVLENKTVSNVSRSLASHAAVTVRACSQAKLRSNFLASAMCDYQLLGSASKSPRNRVRPSSANLCFIFFFQNAAGHFYSRSYGFGVLNANSLIKKAKEWRNVPQQLSYELPGTLTRDSAVIPSRRETVLKVTNFNVLLLICSFL